MPGASQKNCRGFLRLEARARALRPHRTRPVPKLLSSVLAAAVRPAPIRVSIRMRVHALLRARCRSAVRGLAASIAVRRTCASATSSPLDAASVDARTGAQPLRS
eukprot:6202450-Pleurochrysis_carterae.AAC.3